jgi:hypothetical protein
MNLSILRRKGLLALAPMALLTQCAPQQCSPAPAPAPIESPAPAPAPTPPPAPAETVSQQQARISASDYIKYVGGFSRLGLIDQLLYEGFTQADAAYGVDANNIDWNAQAHQSAADYLQYVGGFSHQSLLNQLLYEQFTQAEAEYGVASVGL